MARRCSRSFRNEIRCDQGCCASAALLLALVIGGRAGRRRHATAAANDPRVGLKAGFRDAGSAARNMELVASLPKPEGFFDPKAPAGDADAAGDRRAGTAADRRHRRHRRRRRRRRRDAGRRPG